MSDINVFEEKETAYVEHTFTDEEGNAIVPDSATYTLYDEVSGDIINGRNQTAISGLASSLKLELEPADNPIIEDSKNFEIHILFVQWVYNTDKVGHDEYRFSVRNLTKVT